MFGDIRRLLVLIVTVGFMGGIVLAHRPPENRGAAPGPDPVSSPPPSGLASAPPVPVASVAPPPAPAVSPPAAASPTAAPPTSAPPTSAPPTSAPVAVRSSAGRPDGRRWIDSSAPLAPSRPTRVEIAGIGVSAPVGPLGLNADGSLEVPRDFARAGWYTGRPTPGEAGPAVIVAHRASRRGPGAFWRLPEVQPGEEIVVQRADGRRVLFTVDRVEQHRKDAFPTGAVYGPTPETELRLITCGGPFEPALGDHYRDNIIVFARMKGWAA